MKTDQASHSHDSPETSRSKTVLIATLGVILMLASAARVFYAYDLPINSDEVKHLWVAREISLDPNAFYFPVGNTATNHPNGALYLMAAANSIGGGSVFMIRLVFVAVSVGGLLGLYFLAKSFFGHKAATLAVLVACVDRYLVARSCQLYEPPISLALVPWTLLAIRLSVDRGKPRDWLLLGLLFGVGCNVYHLFLFQPVVFLVYVLLSGKAVSLLKRPWAYAALGLFLALLAPNVLWNLLNEWSNFRYVAAKPGTLGVCPRFAMIYLGDLLLCLKDPVWILMNAGEKLYMPMQVPCHWVAGLAYLGCLLYAACRLREKGVGLLFAAVVVPAAVAAVVAVEEPMDNIRWVQCTIIPAICVTGWAAGQLIRTAAGKAILGAAIAGLGGLLVMFLAGPKWGYFCPEWERAYVGRVLAATWRSEWNPSRFPADQAVIEIRGLTDQAIARNPQSAVAWYYRGCFAQTAAQRVEAFERVLELDPANPLVIQQQADDLIRAGDWAGARTLLQRLLNHRSASYKTYEALAAVEYQLGNYASAAAHARHVLAAKPERFETHLELYAIYDALGNETQRDASLKTYVARHPHGPATAYLSLAHQMLKEGDTSRGRALLEQAIRAKPRRGEEHALIGVLLARMNQMDRAIEHFQTALRLGCREPDVYYNLALAMEVKGEFAQATEYYMGAIQLDRNHGPAHLRLGTLLAAQGRTGEARRHFEAAERLGLRIPSP